MPNDSLLRAAIFLNFYVCGREMLIRIVNQINFHINHSHHFDKLFEIGKPNREDKNIYHKNNSGPTDL